MPRGWEGNRRSGVALAMRHGLKWFIHLRAQRPRVGDEHPAYAPAGAWLPLPFLPWRWMMYRDAGSGILVHASAGLRDGEDRQMFTGRTAAGRAAVMQYTAVSTEVFNQPVA